MTREGKLIFRKLGDEDDEDDPFAQLEEGFDGLGGKHS
jgi:hypothetical protein